jgi:serine/threonine protein kinase
VKTVVGGTFGKYEINRLLGKGGMGEVYEAYDTDKGRTVALKILAERYSEDDTFRARFLRESRAAAVLQEPHVIPIHDWGEIDNTLYIDMRLVQGQTLHDMLRTGPLEPERAVEIIRQVAAALDAAHAEGLIHRDVKPQNIIVTDDDFAYLVDFGIAEAQGEAHLTQTGYQVGSWAYMAPERFRSEETTSAVDTYSLACVLYEALTGGTPFPGETQQVVAGHLSVPPPKPSAANGGVPAAFDEVIARGMAKEPDDRYGSTGALGRAAKRALSSGPTAAAAAETVAASRPSFDQQFGSEHPSGPQYVGGHFGGPQYDYPPTNPGVFRPQDPSGRSDKGTLIAVLAVAGVLLLGVVGVLIGVVIAQKPDPGQNSATPTTVTYTTPGPTSYIAEPSVTTRTTTVAPVTPAAIDPETQLRQIAAGDRSVVAAQLADRWVPQLSSKRPGVVDAGVVWDNAMTLQEHQQLRARYSNVRLLWSGDWSTFSASNFWVTVVGVTYSNPAGALAWCRGNGFDRDHCVAKVVSMTHPVDGSTAYN